MATAVLTTDLTEITTSETTTGWKAIRNSSMIKLDDWGPRQGVGAVGAEVSGINLQGVAWDATTLDLTNTHVFIWLKSPTGVTDIASGGIRMYMEDTAGNWGEWIVGGLDTYTGGWQMFVVDTTRTPDFNSGTDPDMSIIQYVGMVINATGSSNKVQPGFSIDVMRFGNSITVTGGDVTDPITFQDISDADLTPAYGVFWRHASEGTFQLAGRMFIGDAGGVVETYLVDLNQIITAADLPVSASFYQINIAGNSTETTSVVIGTEIGTPPDSVGTTGGLVKSVSELIARHYQLNSADADIGLCDFLGFTILGASTILWDQPENRAISCLFSGCDRITLDNQATIRNSTIDGAEDVGIFLVEPTTGNTFRDMTIQNCPTGTFITSASTYEFKNIQFVGNGIDINTAHSVGSVTISLLEGSGVPTVSSGSGPVKIDALTQVTLTGLVSGTEVIVQDTATGAEIAHVENVGDGGEFAFSDDAGNIVDIFMHAIEYVWLSIDGFEVPSVDADIPISQQFDRNYENPT